ncbi:hypothetical protein OIE13_31470 [Streptosporangium sp. NBC_01810]|uniref:hypothetical protein n=1 Tax=Streptosporangium sp. NBC_01810 TaxID=2975951 RepID=UPI002DDB6887|nr:hypothetical protein [Streptosporangium sp. NBC_01810]WSA25392.1 hypothetical protein OIE13_31470 [Streptosporangium sp. NBC_01810]
MSSRADAEAARVARQVQQHAPTWLVMWSLRHRRFEAWQCSDPKSCRTVHGRTAAELWNRMQQVELELRRTLPRGAAQPTPAANGRLSSPVPVAPGYVPGPRPHPDERTRP